MKHSRRNLTKSRGKVAFGAVLAIGATVGGIAVASSSATPQDTRAPEAAIALLDRPAAASSDANPFASQIGRTLAEQGGYTIDPSTARSVDVGGLTVWVAPNDRRDVCTALQADEGPLSINCAPSAVVASNGLFSTTIGARGASTATVVGVVPDGITQVRFNGQSTPTLVVDNVVVARSATAPTGATLVRANGATAVTFGGSNDR